MSCNDGTNTVNGALQIQSNQDDDYGPMGLRFITVWIYFKTWGEISKL